MPCVFHLMSWRSDNLVVDEIHRLFPDLEVNEETHGNLYSLTFTIPEEPSFQLSVTHSQNIELAINSYFHGTLTSSSWILDECSSIVSTIWTARMFEALTSTGRPASKAFTVILALTAE